MALLHYLEIENFKCFGERQRIELDHPAVLVGPNDCGKTAVVQAIALWSQAVRTWFDAKGESPPKQRPATPLNRLNVTSVPVPSTRCFWHDMVVRSGARPVEVAIEAGVRRGGRVERVEMTFQNRGDDIVYCRPSPTTLRRPKAIRAAAGIRVELLYPMSGLEAEEPVLQPGRVNVLLGQGQTAQVLRNLCLLVFKGAPDEWRLIVEVMRRLFSVQLGEPVENARGSIDLHYRQAGVLAPMELSLAGRGLQQMLLLLAYLHLHPRSVLLIDEPDAHLELLRQRQVYVLLREVAARKGSQVVMTTHSEVVLNEAVAGNVTLLLGGRAHRLSPPGQARAQARTALQHYGAEHYVRARQQGYVLYVEGSTDVEILRAFAERVGHPVAGKWDEGANVYYVRDNNPNQSLDAQLDRAEDGFGMTSRQHFHSLRKMLSELRGLAILGGNGKAPPTPNPADDGLDIVRWARYEVENYFVTPQLLLKYVRAATAADGQGTVFAAQAEGILDALVLERVFGGVKDAFGAWKEAGQPQARLIWEGKTAGMKLSDFAEEFFRQLADALPNQPMLLRKSTLHRLIPHADAAAIPQEVREKLDLVEELFDDGRAGGGEGY